MTTLVLVAGAAGSGKSTIALPLAKLLGAQTVSIDPYKRQVVDPTALCEGLDPPAVRWRYYTLALDQVFALFKAGVEYVILEEMFHVGELRRRVDEECAARGVATRWIEVLCPDALVYRRIEKQPRNGHILNSQQLRAIREDVLRQFDPFPLDDGHLILNNARRAEECAECAAEWVRRKQ